MFDADRWREIFNTLSRNPLRTGLTAFGVFWGILMLIIVLGAVSGLSNGILKNFRGSATNSFFIWGQFTSEPYRGLPKNRQILYEDADLEMLKRALPEAKVILPRIQLGGFRGTSVVTRKLKSQGFTVSGDYPPVQELESLKILSGRFLNTADMNDRRKVAVIGKRVRDVLFEKGENPIGQSIAINGVYFTVIGTFQGNSFGRHGDGDEKVFIPFTTFQYAFNARNFIDFFAITAQDSVDVEMLESKTIALLKARHHVAPSDVRAIGHFNLAMAFKKISSLFLGMALIGWIVSIGTLLAGVIGVSNIMLIIVKERTKEIGIRRAIGARPWSIISQILAEAVVLTGLAGYAGLLVGLGILELISTMLEKAAAANPEAMIPFKNPSVDISTVLIAVVILVFFGMLAGIIPARKAMSITAVDALRAD